jgi:hypothetical protein
VFLLVVTNRHELVCLLEKPQPKETTSTAAETGRASCSDVFCLGSILEKATGFQNQKYQQVKEKKRRRRVSGRMVN